MQLLDAGRRAEAEGKFDYATQLYRHLTEYYAFTSEAAEARNGLGRIGTSAPMWGENGAAAPSWPASQPYGGQNGAALSRPVPRARYYRTGRVLAMVVSCLGWLIAAAGVLMVPVLLMAEPQLLQQGFPYAAALGSLGGVAASVALAAAGLLVVFWGQMASALFDQANASRELVALERSRQSGH